MAGESVAVIPQTNGAVDFGGLMKLCEALVPTGFLPDSIKTAGQAAAIVLAGQELGMSPMLALRSIHIVKGKVVVAADAQLALFKARGGRAHFAELTDVHAILDLTHPNGDTHREIFTMADATRAGLTKPSYKGEPSMFTKHPRAMLRSRCITAGLKSIGFEPTAGSYDPEEAQAFTVTEDSVPGAGTAAPLQMPTVSSLGEAASGSGVREIDGEVVDDEITRDTPFPNGRLKGQTIAQMSIAALLWGIEDGRKLGERTDEWQQAMRAEYDRRTAQAREDDAELSEKLGEPV